MRSCYLTVASLVIAPLLMSVGDLFHPPEAINATEQAAFIIAHPSRWYTAHLMLFVGLLLFIPGVLTIARLTAEQREMAGYVAQVLLLIGFGAFSAIFVTEMMIGRYVSDGADIEGVTALLRTFQSRWVLGVAAPAGLAFFAGVAVVTITLARNDGSLRWPALVLALGAALIFAEIATATVLLSQIGNILILAAGGGFAWHILKHDDGVA